MYLYNSLSHKKELFVPNNPDLVKMYTCGPTVYHFAHIGNLRTYIMEDVLEKALRYSGYNVKRVMNITDVGHLASDADTGEDKMLKGAKRENKSVMDIARFYTDAFKADCDKLNIKWPDVVEPATNCIDEYIHMVQTLLEKGSAYMAGGNVYFDTAAVADYICSEQFLRIIETHGTDKILFASDAPWDNPLKEVKMIAELPFSQQDKDLIFYKNAEKLINT